MRAITRPIEVDYEVWDGTDEALERIKKMKVYVPDNFVSLGKELQIWPDAGGFYLVLCINQVIVETSYGDIFTFDKEEFNKLYNVIE